MSVDAGQWQGKRWRQDTAKGAVAPLPLMPLKQAMPGPLATPVCWCSAPAPLHRPRCPHGGGSARHQGARAHLTCWRPHGLARALPPSAQITLPYVSDEADTDEVPEIQFGFEADTKASRELKEAFLKGPAKKVGSDAR